MLSPTLNCGPMKDWSARWSNSLASTVEGVVAKNLNVHGQTVAVKATKRASVDPHSASTSPRKAG